MKLAEKVNDFSDKIGETVKKYTTLVGRLGLNVNQVDMDIFSVADEFIKREQSQLPVGEEIAALDIETKICKWQSSILSAKESGNWEMLHFLISGEALNYLEANKSGIDSQDENFAIAHGLIGMLNQKLWFSQLNR